MKELRPWGHYEILLDSDKCKVKKITIKPTQRLSYQFHYNRKEIWTLISGAGILTLDEIHSNVSAGDVIQIDKKQKHRIHNNHDCDLVFIEVQLGSYFGEDDIVRIEDDYGRG